MLKGSSNEVISANISELMHSGRKHSQAVAISMSQAHKKKKYYDKSDIKMARRMMK